MATRPGLRVLLYSSVALGGNDFRRMLGYDTFKSTLFAVAVGA